MRARTRWLPAAAMFVFAALLTTVAAASPVVINLADWQGSASSTPCLCPILASTAEADVHQFSVPDVGGSLSVRIQWETGALSDLDLYVDRLVNSTWTEVAHSANSQLTSPAEESVVLASPPAGTYRTRVVNFLSLVTEYHGEAWFHTTG